MAQRRLRLKSNSGARYALTPTEVSALIIMAGAPEIKDRMPTIYKRLQSRLKSDFARRVGETIVGGMGSQTSPNLDEAAVVRAAEAMLGRPLEDIKAPAKPLCSKAKVKVLKKHPRLKIYLRRRKRSGSKGIKAGEANAG